MVTGKENSNMLYGENIWKSIFSSTVSPLQISTFLYRIAQPVAKFQQRKENYRIWNPEEAT